MMGRLNRDQGQLFYEFRLDEVVPEDLGQQAKAVDFEQGGRAADASDAHLSQESPPVVAAFPACHSCNVTTHPSRTLGYFGAQPVSSRNFRFETLRERASRRPSEPNGFASQCGGAILL
jgi:hypothetical protein